MTWVGTDHLTSFNWQSNLVYFTNTNIQFYETYSCCDTKFTCSFFPDTFVQRFLQVLRVLDFSLHECVTKILYWLPFPKDVVRLLFIVKFIISCVKTYWLESPLVIKCDLTKTFHLIIKYKFMDKREETQCFTLKCVEVCHMLHDNT